MTWNNYQLQNCSKMVKYRLADAHHVRLHRIIWVVSQLVKVSDAVEIVGLG